MLLSKVATKYSAYVVNALIVLTLPRPLETPYYLSWPTCSLLWNKTYW